MCQQNGRNPSEEGIDMVIPVSVWRCSLETWRKRKTCYLLSFWRRRRKKKTLLITFFRLFSFRRSLFFYFLWYSLGLFSPPVLIIRWVFFAVVWYFRHFPVTSRRFRRLWLVGRSQALRFFINITLSPFFWNAAFWYFLRLKTRFSDCFGSIFFCFSCWFCFFLVSWPVFPFFCLFLCPFHTEQHVFCCCRPVVTVSDSLFWRFSASLFKLFGFKSLGFFFHQRVILTAPNAFNGLLVAFLSVSEGLNRYFILFQTRCLVFYAFASIFLTLFKSFKEFLRLWGVGCFVFFCSFSHYIDFLVCFKLRISVSLFFIYLDI